MQIPSRTKIVVHLCGFLVLLYSLSMIPPMLLALIDKDRSLFAFLITFVCFSVLGGFCWVTTRQENVQLKTQDGFIIIVLFWLLFSVISAMPLWLNDSLHISLADALFEGVSGITTTGASIFNNVSLLPRSILYYRAQLNFIGGLGVIVLAVAVLPLLGIGGMKLYQSEMPGPFKEERLTPRLADTSRNLWFTYLLLGLACTIAYMFAGMPWFDALCHGLSTVSLGGFSTRSESIGFFDNQTVELVAGVFSLLSGINFTLYFVAIIRRSIQPFRRNPELRFYFTVAAILVTIVAFEVWRAGMYSPGDSLVHAFFLTSSMLTDNGLATGDYAHWPTHTIVLLLCASFFGGCVGSTCGGLKMMRLLILLRQSRHELHQLAHPRALISIKVGKTVMSDRVVRSVGSFLFSLRGLYLSVHLVTEFNGLRLAHFICDRRRLYQQHGPGFWSDGQRVRRAVRGRKIFDVRCNAAWPPGNLPGSYLVFTHLLAQLMPPAGFALPKVA